MKITVLTASFLVALLGISSVAQAGLETPCQELLAGEVPWYVLADNPSDGGTQFILVGDKCPKTRAGAQDAAALARAQGEQGAHAIPEKAYLAQKASGLVD